MSTSTIADAFESFNTDVRPHIDADDDVALSEAWNDYTDSLCKDGDLSDILYRLCPAVSDVQPSDDDMDVVIDAIGLTMVAQQVYARPDGGRWPDGARHFLVTLKIADRTMTVPYSMGPHLKCDPTVEDVIGSVILDISSVAGLAVDSESDFSQWCDEIGYDDDSRKAHRAYCACVALRASFVTLLGGVISEREFGDLQAIVE